MRNRLATADDGQPAELDLINTILKREFAPYTTEQIAKLNYKDAAKFRFELKSRQEHIKRLKSGEQFDLLIVGGGANGAGVVLDAASRGLNCAIIDSFDFASGTSSKSTKMAHGGIRYF
jgi:glycerol-3-phosphate dehydrogenase